MNNYKNFRRGQNEAMYSDGFFTTTRKHPYCAEPTASADIHLSSTAQLVSSGRAPFEAYHSCPQLASLASPLPTLPSVTSLAIGDSEGEPSSTSLAKGLPSKSLDCMPLLVFVLVMCVFITLAIWATALVQDDLHDSHIEAVDDVDAGKHFAKFGGLKPTPGTSEQKSTQKEGMKITARTRKRAKSKRTSTTLDGSDVTTASLEHLTVEDKAHDHEKPLVTGGKYTRELVKTRSNERTTIINPRKPLYRRRRLPHKNHTPRSTRRRPSKRIHRHRHVRKHAVPPTEYHGE